MADEPAVVTPRRIQLRRTKGWRLPPNTVNIARPSKYGNPYKVEDAFWAEGISMPAVTREDAVRLYRENLTPRCQSFPSVMRELRADLRGKNLACWCALDQPCHADVLLELANA